MAARRDVPRQTVGATDHRGEDVGGREHPPGEHVDDQDDDRGGDGADEEDGLVERAVGVDALELGALPPSRFGDPPLEAVLPAGHLQDADAGHGLPHQDDPFVRDRGHPRAQDREALAQPQLQRHEEEEEEAEAGEEGPADDAVAHAEDGDGRGRGPEEVEPEEGRQHEPLHVVRRQVDDLPRRRRQRPPGGGGVVMAARRGWEPQALVVDGGHARDAILHPLPPVPEEHVVVLQQDDQAPNHQQTRPQVGLKTSAKYMIIRPVSLIGARRIRDVCYEWICHIWERPICSCCCRHFPDFCLTH